MTTSMGEVAIRVEGLGKLYRLGKRERYRTLRDTLTDTFLTPFRLFRGKDRLDGEAPLLWALRDVSFDVKRGEVLGIIGRNGAGKSTLLKILSRITEPTEGRAMVSGRLASLLEVGTGFHPELTGRENIFLNAAILGMKKEEIGRKFDEIVDFAEISKFVDTPVKHYSSGMYVRLAFAVAAHLEPDILIVDEVLAVGDAQFQKKCLGKLRDVANERRRTVVFVSHQMNQIRKLCSTCAWLENGKVRELGQSETVISSYEDSFTRRAHENRPTDDRNATRFVSWAVDSSTVDTATVEVDRAVRFRFRIFVAKHISNGHHGIALSNSDNLLIWSHAFNNLDLSLGDHELYYDFPILPIRPGVYRWRLSIYQDGTLLDDWDALPPLRVHTPLISHAQDAWQGVLNIPFSMHVEAERCSSPSSTQVKT